MSKICNQSLKSTSLCFLLKKVKVAPSETQLVPRMNPYPGAAILYHSAV